VRGTSGGGQSLLRPVGAAGISADVEPRAALDRLRRSRCALGWLVSGPLARGDNIDVKRMIRVPYRTPHGGRRRTVRHAAGALISPSPPALGGSERVASSTTERASSHRPSPRRRGGSTGRQFGAPGTSRGQRPHTSQPRAQRIPTKSGERRPGFTVPHTDQSPEGVRQPAILTGDHRGDRPFSRRWRMRNH